MRRLRLLAILLVAASALGIAACTDDPTVPTPLPPPSGGGGETGTLSGTVVGYFDRAPLSGATVIHGSSAAVTNAAGEFTLNAVPTTGAVGVVVNAPGHVYRRVVYNMTPNRTGVTIDVIRDTAPFDFTFYRAWVRDLAQSQTLAATKPWTVDPSFYFKTVLGDTGEPVPDAVIDRIVGIFSNAVVALSGGRRKIDRVERNPSTREQLDGWVNVTFVQNLGGALGRSSVGGNSGTINLVYGALLQSTPLNNPYDCEFYLYSIADHEITHTMGFYHTFDTIADAFSGPGCTGTTYPERTRIHSAIMYSRPFGNTDPDIDPASSAQLTAPEPGFQPVVECFRQ